MIPLFDKICTGSKFDAAVHYLVAKAAIPTFNRKIETDFKKYTFEETAKRIESDAYSCPCVVHRSEGGYLKQVQVYDTNEVKDALKHFLHTRFLFMNGIHQAPDHLVNPIMLDHFIQIGCLDVDYECQFPLARLMFAISSHIRELCSKPLNLEVKEYSDIRPTPRELAEFIIREEMKFYEDSSPDVRHPTSDSRERIIIHDSDTFDALWMNGGYKLKGTRISLEIKEVVTESASSDEQRLDSRKDNSCPTTPSPLPSDVPKILKEGEGQGIIANKGKTPVEGEQTPRVKVEQVRGSSLLRSSPQVDQISPRQIFKRRREDRDQEAELSPIKRPRLASPVNLDSVSIFARQPQFTERQSEPESSPVPMLGDQAFPMAGLESPSSLSDAILNDRTGELIGTPLRLSHFARSPGLSPSPTRANSGIMHALGLLTPSEDYDYDP